MKEVDKMSTEMKESSLQITGMTCAACASRIEKGLNKMDGVKKRMSTWRLKNHRLNMIHQS